MGQRQKSKTHWKSESKHIKHMCIKSGANRISQETLEGNKWGVDVQVCCMGGPLGHGVGQGSEARVETWERQRGHKLYTRKNATWVVQGGEW